MANFADSLFWGHLVLQGPGLIEFIFNIKIFNFFDNVLVSVFNAALDEL